MPTRNRPTVKRAVALGMALAMTCPPAGGLLSVAQAQPAATPAPAPAAPAPAAAPTAAPAAAVSPATPPLAIKSILLFPFSSDAGDAAVPIAARVDDAVKLRINAVGAFTATTYTPLLAPVQRALSDNVLTKDDIAGPFTDKQKADRIATQVSTDAFMIGSVESFNADPSTKKVTLEVSAVLYNTATGTVLRTLAFSGAAAPSSTNEDQDAVTQSAINDVAGKIASNLNASAPKPAPIAAAPPSHSRNNGIGVVLFGVLASALLYAASQHHSSGGSSNGGGGGNGPPPPPSGGPPAPPT